MCGREPNFELPEAEKQELRKFNWDEFLAMTRHAITNRSKSLFSIIWQMFPLLNIDHIEIFIIMIFRTEEGQPRIKEV